MDDFNMEKFVKNLKQDMYEGFGNLTNKFKETIDTMAKNTVYNQKASNDEAKKDTDLSSSWWAVDNQKVSNNEAKKGTNLSSPWWEYYHKLEALFGQDPEIHMEFYNKQNKKIVISVDNCKKADAIEKLLPSEVYFGNVTVTIMVSAPNNHLKNRANLFDIAFKGNPIFDCTINVGESFPIAGGTTYVMFRKKVAQFFNDNLADPNGNSSYLCADIAEDVFGHVEGEALHFSTSTEE